MADNGQKLPIWMMWPGTLDVLAWFPLTFLEISRIKSYGFSVPIEQARRLCPKIYN